LIYQPFGIFLDILSGILHSFSSFLDVNKKIVSYFEKFNGLLFLIIEEFDGSFLMAAFLIERECVYLLPQEQVSWYREILFAGVQNVNSLDGKSSISERTGMNSLFTSV
jgi:hypothetical protein